MEDKDLIETYISTKPIFDGKVLNLSVDTVRLPDGKEAFREVIHHKGAVAVIPIDGDGNVILEHQFRYPHNRIMVEIPAGKRDSYDEDPYSAAVRELREETGFTAEKIIPLGLYIPSPAILCEKIWVYAAFGLHKGENDLDEDEFIDVYKMPLDTLVDKILNNEIEDGKTVFAALKLKMLLERKTV